MLGRLRQAFAGKRRAAVSFSKKGSYSRCVETVLHIHRAVIIKSGEAREIGLEDAVISMAAVEGFCDRLEYCGDCFSKAALAIDYVANFHPFMEGNKRTAFELAVRLLKNGGYELNDDDATLLFIRDVARGMYDREEVEMWLRRNSRLSTS